MGRINEEGDMSWIKGDVNKDWETLKNMKKGHEVGKEKKKMKREKKKKGSRMKR